jgi:hypothetical protein
MGGRYQGKNAPVPMHGGQSARPGSGSSALAVKQAKKHEWPRMNADKTYPKNCFGFIRVYPCSSVAIYAWFWAYFLRLASRMVL